MKCVCCCFVSCVLLKIEKKRTSVKACLRQRKGRERDFTIWISDGVCTLRALLVYKKTILPPFKDVF